MTAAPASPLAPFMRKCCCPRQTALVEGVGRVRRLALLSQNRVAGAQRRSPPRERGPAARAGTAHREWRQPVVTEMRPLLAGSGGSPVVVPEQPAEALPMLHRASRELENSGLVLVGFAQGHIAPRLVPAFLVIVVSELFHEVREVALAEDQEVVEALLPQRLDPALGVRVHVRRPRPDPLHLTALDRGRKTFARGMMAFSGSGGAVTTDGRWGEVAKAGNVFRPSRAAIPHSYLTF